MPKPQISSAPPVCCRQADRRGFMAKTGAMIIGGILALFPFLTGLVVFLDPLRRKGNSGNWIRVATLNAIPEDGAPYRAPVIADRVDAWNRYPKEPIGAVYLLRQGNVVQALNATCPHAGCFVSYLQDKKYFQCPCHTSAFDLSGARKLEVSDVSPRDMDSLKCEVRPVEQSAATADGGPTDSSPDVWVQFRNFQTGISHKIAKS